MTGLSHPDDDRLLELAYGELPSPEAGALRRHVDGCPRCRDVLEGIAEVRSAVRRVPQEPAPERGLESLLAYGEQAAARARSHRRNVQWLGLLTLATAAGLAWVLVPERRGPVPAASEDMAQVVLRAPPAQGDRLAEEPAEAKAKAAEKPRRNKDAEASNREAEGDTPALLKKQLSRIPTVRQASRDDLDEARSAGAVAAAPSAPPPTDAVERAQAPRAEAKKAESISEEAGLRARTSAAPAKVAAAPPAVAASPAASAPAGPPATSGVGLQGSAAGRVDVGSSSVGSSSVAGLVGSVGSTGSAGAAGGVAADKSDGAFAQAGAGAKEAQKPVTGAPAKNAAGKVGSDWAAREARLAEVRRAVAAATGDARKALLLEQCRLEASLEMRASVVGTCSQVAREFPGTPEAQQAVELARGFSVQPAAPPDR